MPARRFRKRAPVLAAAVFLAAVIRSRHNIGVRHVLPVMALLALPAAQGAVTAWRSTRWRIAGRVSAGAALAWIVALPFAIAPDYFPWFNAQHAKAKPGSPEEARKIIESLDAQEAASVSKSYRRAVSRGEEAPRLLTIGTRPGAAGGESYMPPPSVPQ